MAISFPWRQVATVEAGKSYTALLGFVQLQSILLLPTFARYSVVIDQQMKQSTGIVGYRMGADFWRLKFYHLSAWQDPSSIMQFVHAEPHVRAMTELRERLGATEFRYWQVAEADLPLKLTAELARFQTVT